ncbi:hypothetical protein OIO90_001083 [Microbotryomycetes sp. JL221]|nr:hypothetical protein OIO90_001083 [Microbotryomycetes sp. JL221]
MVPAAINYSISAPSKIGSGWHGVGEMTLAGGPCVEENPASPKSIASASSVSTDTVFVPSHYATAFASRPVPPAATTHIPATAFDGGAHDAANGDPSQSLAAASSSTHAWDNMSAAHFGQFNPGPVQHPTCVAPEALSLPTSMQSSPGFFPFRTPEPIPFYGFAAHDPHSTLGHHRHQNSIVYAGSPTFADRFGAGGSPVGPDTTASAHVLSRTSVSASSLNGTLGVEHTLGTGSDNDTARHFRHARQYPNSGGGPNGDNDAGEHGYYTTHQWQ